MGRRSSVLQPFPDPQNIQGHQPVPVSNKRGHAVCWQCSRMGRKTPGGYQVETSYKCCVCDIPLCKVGCFAEFHWNTLVQFTSKSAAILLNCVAFRILIKKTPDILYSHWLWQNFFWLELKHVKTMIFFCICLSLFSCGHLVAGVTTFGNTCNYGNFAKSTVSLAMQWKVQGCMNMMYHCCNCNWHLPGIHVYANYCIGALHIYKDQGW